MQSVCESRGLAHGEMARYAWGQYKIILAPHAAYEGNSFASKALLQISHNSAQWESERSFFAFISLAHEFVHYQQDLGTGCGHWDHLARRAFMASVIGKACVASWLASLPLDRQTTNALVDDYANASLFNAYSQREGKALALIRKEIRAGSGSFLPGSDAIYGIDSLFELDAVLSVKSSMSMMSGSREANEITNAHGSVWDPVIMAPEYRKPYEQMLLAFRTFLGLDGKDVTRDDVQRIRDFTHSLGPVLLDIAFAHPPPDYFTGDRQDDRPHFEPGVRLIRILRRLQTATERHEGDLPEVIEILSRTSPQYAYPSVRAIYEAWAESFDKLSGESATAKWRRGQCAERLKHPQALEGRALHHIAGHDLPLFIESPAWSGQHLLLTGHIFVDGGALYMEINRDWTTNELVRWQLGLSGDKFVCPLASSNSVPCDAIEDICHAGITHITQFPRDEACYMRDWHERWGFDLGQLLRR